jgi:hypothetical protein
MDAYVRGQTSFAAQLVPGARDAREGLTRDRRGEHIGRIVAALHIDFGYIDVYALIEDDWIKVRSKVTRPGYEEHKGLDEFERRYGLPKPKWELLALARDFESLCESSLEDARNLDDTFAVARWTELLGQCQTAIAAAGTNFGKSA